MKKPLYKSSSLAKKKKSPSMRQMLKKSAFASLTAVTLITTLQFNTDAKRDGHENPLSFAQNIEIKVAKQIDDNLTKYVSPTADAAEVTSSVDKSKLELTGFENAEVFDMTKLADPTGEKDSSEIFHDILQKSVDAPIVLDLGSGGTYKFDSTHNIEVLESKGVKIIGDVNNKPKIDYLNKKTTNLPEFYALQLHMKRGDNIGVQITGVDFDGHRNEQNMFFTFNDTVLNGYGGDVSGFYKTRLAKGVFIGHAEDIAVSDTIFQNAYGGYSLIAEGYKNVNYDNIKIDNVGGDGQTDSLGMFIYFGGHEGDATVNINNVQAKGKIGDGPQSNEGTGYKNPGDPSYYSWIGVVTGENGSIQSTDPANWLVDKNTTFNITNSTFDNVETTFHTESMAGNVALNVNNVKTNTKQLSITAGIKGKFKGVYNKMDITMVPYGRNSTYSSLFSSEFGDDPRYHNGYNANLTDANGGAPLHDNLVVNSKVNFLDREKTPVGAPGSKDVYASIAYGNQVTANFKCTQFDGLWNKAYANGGGTIEDSVINMGTMNQNEATFDGLKGDPGLNTAKWSNVTINKAGSWTDLNQTCQAPTFNNFSGDTAPVLDDPMIPAPIGGTDQPANLAPILSVKDIVIEQGSDFNPLQDVSVTDDHDENLVIDVTGDVDTSKPGEYIQKFSTTDGSGATATGQRKVTVTVKDVPTTEEPTTEAPTTETPTTEKPTTETPTTENPTTETPTTEKPTTENPTTETPTTEQPTTEQPTTPDKENQLPQIFASDLFIMEGTDFNPLKNVKAYDHENGNLTGDIKVIKNTVDTSKPGTGEVVYEVTDPVTKLKGTTTINVTVGKDWTKDMTGMKDISDKLQGQLDDLTKKYDELNSKYDVNTKEIESIKAQIKEVQDAIAVVEKETTKLNDNYDKLKTDSDAMREQVNNVVKNIEEVTQLVNALNEKYDNLKADLDKATDGKAADDATIKALQDGMVKLNDTIKDLQEQINKVTAKLDMPQSEIETKDGNIIITNTNTNHNDNGKTSTETKSDSNSDDAKSTNTNTNDSDDKATAEEPIRTDDKSDEDKAATATPSKDESDKSDDNATKEEVTTEAPEKDGEQNNETKDKSVESAAQKTDESATEIVSTQQSPKTETQQTQAQSTGILPDTGSAWSNLLTYGGASLLLLGIALYMRFERKTKEN